MLPYLIVALILVSQGQKTNHSFIFLHGQQVFCLIWYYRISTIIGYLMPDPVYTYIPNIYIICKHTL